MVTSALEFQHNSRRRNAETNSHTSYISKVHLFKKSYTIILNYLLIHLNQHVKWFSLGEVKKKLFCNITVKFWGKIHWICMIFCLTKNPMLSNSNF